MGLGVTLFSFPPARTSVPGFLSTDPDQVRSSIATHEGWNQFVTYTPKRPPVLTARKYADLSGQQRAEYDQARHTFHRSMVLVQHSQLKAAWNQMAAIVNGADADPGAGMGICVTGDAGMGKTSVVASFARQYQRELAAAYPQAFDQANILLPVCYSALLPGTGLKGNMTHLLRFYNVPCHKSDTGADRMARLIDTMGACQTKILILDQAQNLRSGDRRDAEVAAHLKHLMDESGVVIILAGINMEQSGPLTPKRRASADTDQLAKRFRMIPIKPLEADDPEWVNLLTAAEGTLILTQAQPQDLSARLADQLHRRTGGAIGLTINLIKLAANHAIDTGTERITADLLSRVSLTMDEAAS